MSDTNNSPPVKVTFLASENVIDPSTKVTIHKGSQESQLTFSIPVWADKPEDVIAALTLFPKQTLKTRGKTLKGGTAQMSAGGQHVAQELAVQTAISFGLKTAEVKASGTDVDTGEKVSSEVVKPDAAAVKSNGKGKGKKTEPDATAMLAASTN